MKLDSRLGILLHESIIDQALPLGLKFVILSGSGEPLLWIAALDTFILSFVLIYLKEKTGSLWPPIGLHMLKNSLAFISIFILHIT